MLKFNLSFFFSGDDAIIVRNHDHYKYVGRIRLHSTWLNKFFYLTFSIIKKAVYLQPFKVFSFYF